MSKPTTKRRVVADSPPDPETEKRQEVVESIATSNLQSKCPEVARLQLKRLQEYLAECLALPSAEEAMLGSTAGCLMRVAYRLSDSIDAVLEEGLDNKITSESLIWAINALIRLSGLIERLTHLRLLLSNARTALKQLTDDRE